MEIRSMHFKATANAKMADAAMQVSLKRALGNFVNGRAKQVADLDEFAAVRDTAAEIRNRGLEHLDLWLTKFEQEASARGVTIYWAETGADVNRYVQEIASRHAARKVIKSKSMVSEETGLNEALKTKGIEVIETDLGEYIAQLSNEPPSHLIAPVMHKSKEDVATLFESKHHTPRKQSIPELVWEAREVLRKHFLSADMGISGGNFLVAETGSVCLVTNEGNGRLCTTLPKVHVAITGIEKVIPTLEDLSTLMRILARSATGQSISNYVTVLTGPRGPQDLDGPEHMYVILVDSGRTSLLGTDFQEMLRCIRCGACMNHCPVYHSVGGHSYGWVYPGPMGSVLTPLFAGIEKSLDLPNASTLCGECHVVCPVKIPLPDLLRKLREKQVEMGLRPWQERLGIRLWSYAAQRPLLYGLLTKIGMRYLKWSAGGRDRLSKLPLGAGWTVGRDMPTPPGRTFRELHAQRERSR